MSKDSENKESNNFTKIENSWIFLAKDGFVKDSQGSIVTLRHPKYDKKTKYLLCPTVKKVYEIQTFDSQCRSWLVDETLRRDGNIYICTPIDPLFFLLPYLKDQCLTRAVPLEQILGCDHDLNLEKLLQFIPDLHYIGDIKGSSDLNAYKYSEEKTVSILNNHKAETTSI